MRLSFGIFEKIHNALYENPEGSGRSAATRMSIFGISILVIIVAAVAIFLTLLAIPIYLVMVVIAAILSLRSKKFSFRNALGGPFYIYKYFAS